MEHGFVKYDSQKDFTSLEAWRKARTLKIFFYKEIIPLLPNEEKFNLNTQIRRASISVTANISEGYGRYHYNEGIQYFRIARGSIYELKDHIISCYDLDFIKHEILKRGIGLIEDAKITLNGYIKYIKERQERRE